MSSVAVQRFEERQSCSRETSPAAENTNNGDAVPQNTNEDPDAHSRYIIRKYKLEDVVPSATDYDSARANMLPLDGTTPIFAGGRPIHTRRESSSPAVVEALHRGFHLAHFPSRALLPEDMFSTSAAAAAASGGGADATVLGAQRSTMTYGGTNKNSNSPEPALPVGRAASSASGGHHHHHHHHHVSPSPAHQQQRQQRIPGNISPHVLPQGALLQPLPPARELVDIRVPLAEPPRYAEQLQVHQVGVDMGSWALSDPEMITNMARHFRRCFPRTEKDDLYDSFPTDRSGNYILRRYGGAHPPHRNYSHYRKYSEFGINTTAEFHNFPAGRHPYAP